MKRLTIDDWRLTIGSASTGEFGASHGTAAQPFVTSGPAPNGAFIFSPGRSESASLRVRWTSKPWVTGPGIVRRRASRPARRDSIDGGTDKTPPWSHTHNSLAAFSLLFTLLCVFIGGCAAGGYDLKFVRKSLAPCPATHLSVEQIVADYNANAAAVPKLWSRVLINVDVAGEKGQTVSWGSNIGAPNGLLMVGKESPAAPDFVLIGRQTSHEILRIGASARTVCITPGPTSATADRRGTAASTVSARPARRSFSSTPSAWWTSWAFCLCPRSQGNCPPWP